MGGEGGGRHRLAAPDWKRAAMSRSCSAAAAAGWKLVAGGGVGLEAGSRRRGQWSGQLVRAGARASGSPRPCWRAPARRRAVRTQAGERVHAQRSEQREA